jgi:hypothetical protein
MSRSYKLAIKKDRGLKSYYWKKIRRITKQIVKSLSFDNADDIYIPNPKEVMNDYDYCDYVIDYEYDRSSSYFWYNDKKHEDSHNQWVDKMKRK